jgi:hypothetical protein
VKEFPGVVIKREGERWHPFRIRGLVNMQKSACGDGVQIGLANGGLGIGGNRVSRSDSANRVFIIQSSAAKFLHSAWMNAMILPVSVPAKDEDVLNLCVGEPLKKGVRFVSEAVKVRVVIAFAGTIGSDERGGGDDDFPFCRT